MTDLLVPALIVYSCLCAGIAVHLARSRVPDESWFALWGFLFGILAIAYLLMKPPIFREDGGTRDEGPRHGAAPGLHKGKRRAD